MYPIFVGFWHFPAPSPFAVFDAPNLFSEMFHISDIPEFIFVSKFMV
jgi:hypothetical protein